MDDVTSAAVPDGRAAPAAEAEPHVLVVDDDPTVAEVVVGYLRRAGMVATHAADGPAALAAAESDPPDLVVLDLMLPGIDGLEVCRRLRIRRPDLPVVMLTALGAEADRVAGLERGADDYVTKPFSPRELVLRVESVLRRATPRERSGGVLTDGDLRVDLAARRVTKGEVELALTNRELDLLTFLLQHPGVVLTRDELMRQVWGWDVGDRSTVTVHVRRLREKVERDPSDPRLVVTVRGTGYRFDPEEGGA
jgi:DNA-binding response OmpR family regulator